jgi:succinate-acetate transporter protein
MMEDEDMPMPAPMDPAAAMRAMALSAVGDFMLFLGVIFVLLGVANFTTDFLKIKGSGEFGVGLALIASALILLMRTRASISKVAPRPPMAKKGKESKSDAYR